MGNVFSCSLTTGGGGDSGKGTLTVIGSDVLAGITCTCTNGVITLTNTFPSEAPYNTTFNIPSAGSWTVSVVYHGDTHSETVVISLDQTVDLGAFALSAWLEAGEITGTYSTLNDVLSDELAVRKLCLKHNAVDYLASRFVDTNLETIFSNDLFAKWTNNSDYALDKYATVNDLVSLMNSVDKYGYGEWVLQPQVPKMTSNTAPYGEAFSTATHSSGPAYYAFANDASISYVGITNGASAGEYVGYHHIKPVSVKKATASFFAYRGYHSTIALQGSHDNSTWNDISEEVEISSPPLSSGSVISDIDFTITDFDAYEYHRIIRKANTPYTTGGDYDYFYVSVFKMYDWQPKGNVPIMTANNAPYGEASCNYTPYGSTAAWQAFDGNPATGVYGPTSGTYANVTYKLVNPTCVKKIRYHCTLSGTAYAFKGSNDGITWEPLASGTPTLNMADVEVDVNNDEYYLYYYFEITGGSSTATPCIVSLQFYGRELKVSVPTMTSNTTPYGEALASSYNSSAETFKAFDNSDSTSWGSATSNNEWVAYDFTKSIAPRQIRCKQHSQARSAKFAIYGSNVKPTTSNYADWTKLTSDISIGTSEVIENISNSTSFRYLIWREELHTSSYTGTLLMSLQFYCEDYSEKEFETGTTRKWLYDHGVELEELGKYCGSQNSQLPINDGNEMYFPMISGSGNATTRYEEANVQIDLSNYQYMRAIGGSRMKLVEACIVVEANPNTGSSYVTAEAYCEPVIPITNRYNTLILDVSTYNQQKWIGVGAYSASGRESSITEWWLE